MHMHGHALHACKDKWLYTCMNLSDVMRIKVIAAMHAYLMSRQTLNCLTV